MPRKPKSGRSASPATEQSVPSSTPYKRAQRKGGTEFTRGSVRPGRLENSSLAVDLIGNLGRTSVPGAPSPNLYTGATGHNFATEVIRDRVMPAKVAVWAPFTSTFGPVFSNTQYFDPGTTPDPDVAAMLGPLFKTMYSSIVRELQIDGNMMMRDTTLDNNGNITDSFGYWLSVYGTVFTTLRGLQGCLGMGNFNYPASLIANAVNTQIFGLEGALRQLMTFSVPPLFIRYLDRLCGPIAMSEDDPLIIAGVNSTAGANIDLTVSANIATLIAGCNTFLQVLGAGSANLATLDAQRIASTFAMAYGTPEFPVSKGIQYDPAVYLMHLFQAGTYRNTTSGDAITFPNYNASAPAGTIPIMVPRDYSDREVLGQLFSLWRSPVYSRDAVAGILNPNIVSQVGLWSNQATATTGSNFAYYHNDGTYTSRTNAAAGTFAITYAQPELEMAPWISESAAGATNYSADTRIWQDVDRVYATVQQLIDQTMYITEEMFLNPIRSKRG